MKKIVIKRIVVFSAFAFGMHAADKPETNTWKLQFPDGKSEKVSAEMAQTLASPFLDNQIAIADGVTDINISVGTALDMRHIKTMIKDPSFMNILNLQQLGSVSTLLDFFESKKLADSVQNAMITRIISGDCTPLDLTPDSENVLKDEILTDLRGSAPFLSDLLTGTPLPIPELVNLIKMSPRGKYALVGKDYSRSPSDEVGRFSMAQELWVAESFSGRRICDVWGRSGQVHLFSPDESLLLATISKNNWAQDKRFRITNLTDTAQREEIEASGDGNIKGFSISPDNELIAVRKVISTQIIERKSHQCRGVLPHDADCDVQFSSMGTAVGVHQNEVYTWDCKTLNLINRAPVGIGIQEVRSLAISPDGKQLGYITLENKGGDPRSYLVELGLGEAREFYGSWDQVCFGDNGAFFSLVRLFVQGGLLQKIKEKKQAIYQCPASRFAQYCRDCSIYADNDHGKIMKYKVGFADDQQQFLKQLPLSVLQMMCVVNAITLHSSVIHKHKLKDCVDKLEELQKQDNSTVAQKMIPIILKHLRSLR